MITALLVDGEPKTLERLADFATVDVIGRDELSAASRGEESRVRA